MTEPEFIELDRAAKIEYLSRAFFRFMLRKAKNFEPSEMENYWVKLDLGEREYRPLRDSTDQELLEVFHALEQQQTMLETVDALVSLSKAFGGPR